MGQDGILPECVADASKENYVYMCDDGRKIDVRHVLRSYRLYYFLFSHSASTILHIGVRGARLQILAFVYGLWVSFSGLFFFSSLLR